MKILFFAVSLRGGEGKGVGGITRKKTLLYELQPFKFYTLYECNVLRMLGSPWSGLGRPTGSWPSSTSTSRTKGSTCVRSVFEPFRCQHIVEEETQFMSSLY